MRISGLPRVRLCLKIKHAVPGVALCVQRGRDGLLPPIAVSADEVTFEFSLEVQTGADGSMTLRGPEVQGPPAARFVYVTVGTRAQQPASPWNRRAKVSLMSVRDADMLHALEHSSSVLVAEIEGRARDGGPACASVPLLDGGWRLDSVHTRNDR